ncbi:MULTISPECIES: hypothetical protein [Cytobacillus]|uniref:hypothetical protein n=1 Tax=Cytobacillus TaxID=2675230 RepID=UPI00203D93F4|nr:hypothetical protein [Cytobacillus firmus]MCM3707415.1 hypothetical protein [Cytobacillus firmus]
MQNKLRILLFNAGMSLLLGGCIGQESKKERESSQICVLDYTGEDYALPYGSVTNESLIRILM